MSIEVSVAAAISASPSGARPRTIISFPPLPETVGSFSSTAKNVVTSSSTARRTLPGSIGESCSFRVLRVGVAASGEMIYPSREAQ